MIKELELSVSPDFLGDEQYLLDLATKKLRIEASRIKDYHIRKRAIDARNKHVVYKLWVLFYIDERKKDKSVPAVLKSVSDAKPVIIVGAGPAGLFAAYRCIERGFKPIVLERGKDVRQRRRDLARINKEGKVNPESNYCFGEGGAGTYSDGKLYTRSDKRGDVRKVLELFVQHGADPDIMVNARPHIGTNKLPHIITAIRNTVIDLGGAILFDTKVIDILVEEGQVKGVLTECGKEFLSAHVVLATGHSARDIYELFNKKEWLLEAKPFALGVRIEHPQHIIDSAQYHCNSRHPNLPPAYYNLVQQVDNRGVFSFCMCPGGVIAPCSTDVDEIVVNGWSPSKRNNPFANSGTVIQVNKEDVPRSLEDPFALLDFQREIEKRAFRLGGGNLVAPAQRMVDFVENRLSKDIPLNSYKPGTKSVELKEVLPDFVYTSLRTALPMFGKKMKGYYTNEAVLVGVESRTSSAIRIPRDKVTFQHPQVKGLYPCAEGAGYAGGILSAAIDGINCVDRI